MWNYIKKRFTGSSKVDELNIEIKKITEERDEAKRNYKGVVEERDEAKRNHEGVVEERDEAKRNYKGVVKHIRKLNDVVEKLEEDNYILREAETFQEDMEVDDKGEADYNIELKQRKDREVWYNKLMEGKIGHQNTFYHSFIEWTFAELFKIKKGKLNKKIRTSSTKHIILDTSVIMEPYDREGNHAPLKELLDDIEKLKQHHRGILSKTLIGEYEKQLFDLKPKDDGQFTKLTIFPVLEMAKFFDSCFGIEETENIEKIAEQIRNKIPPRLKDEFLKLEKNPDGKKRMSSFENDTLFAAIAQVYECVLVTNDKALLELGKLPDYKLQVFHHSTKSEYKNYPHINRYIKPLISVDEKQNQ